MIRVVSFKQHTIQTKLTDKRGELGGLLMFLKIDTANLHDLCISISRVSTAICRWIRAFNFQVIS